MNCIMILYIRRYTKEIIHCIQVLGTGYYYLNILHLILSLLLFLQYHIYQLGTGRHTQKAYTELRQNLYKVFTCSQGYLEAKHITIHNYDIVALILSLGILWRVTLKFIYVYLVYLIGLKELVPILHAKLPQL